MPGADLGACGASPSRPGPIPPWGLVCATARGLGPRVFLAGVPSCCALREPCSGRGAGRRGAAPDSLPSRGREHRFLLNTEFLIPN